MSWDENWFWERRVARKQKSNSRIKIHIESKKRGLALWMKTQSLLTKDKPEMLSKNVKEKDKGIQIMIENKEREDREDKLHMRIIGIPT